MLPEDCVSVVLCRTSPPEACRSSTLSSTFRSAALYDVVWESFLPADYKDLVSRSVTPLTFTSKKELFLLLCNPVLIDGGKKVGLKMISRPNISSSFSSTKNLMFSRKTCPFLFEIKHVLNVYLHHIHVRNVLFCLKFQLTKSFKLERSSGRISYLLSARELSITGISDPMCWSWRSTPESRFSEVAQLRTTHWLEIHGKIKTEVLSPNTTYGAYLVIKIYDQAYGLDAIPSEISVAEGDQIRNRTVYLRRHGDGEKQQMECLCYMNRMEVLRKRVTEGDEQVPIERRDEWMEIELGEFFTGEASKEVKMSLMEIKGYQLKGGLAIEGIEVRPID